jgi:hypothetical protein
MLNNINTNIEKLCFNQLFISQARLSLSADTNSSALDGAYYSNHNAQYSRCHDSLLGKTRTWTPPYGTKLTNAAGAVMGSL